MASLVPSNFGDVVDAQLLKRDRKPLTVDSLLDGQRGEANILSFRYKHKRIERKGEERSQRNDVRDPHDLGFATLRFVRGRPGSKDERSVRLTSVMLTLNS
jgi:hypothetical protein